MPEQVRHFILRFCCATQFALRTGGVGSHQQPRIFDIVLRQAWLSARLCSVWLVDQTGGRSSKRATLWPAPTELFLQTLGDDDMWSRAEAALRRALDVSSPFGSVIGC